MYPISALDIFQVKLSIHEIPTKKGKSQDQYNILKVYQLNIIGHLDPYYSHLKKKKNKKYSGSEIFDMVFYTQSCVKIQLKITGDYHCQSKEKCLWCSRSTNDSLLENKLFLRALKKIEICQAKHLFSRKSRRFQSWVARPRE